MRAYRDERGQSLVEFALVIPIIMLLMVGLFDLGRIVFINNSLSDGAKHGARHASTNPRSAEYCDAIDEAVRTAIRGQELSQYTVTYTTVDPGGTPTGTYLLCEDGGNGPDNGSLPVTAGPGDLVRVDLAADVELAIGFIAQATGRDTFNLEAESTMEVTYAPVTVGP